MDIMDTYHLLHTAISIRNASSNSKLSIEYFRMESLPRRPSM